MRVRNRGLGLLDTILRDLCPKCCRLPRLRAVMVVVYNTNSRETRYDDEM